jgi:hypothetical protein
MENPGVTSLDNKDSSVVEEKGPAWTRPAYTRKNYFDYLDVSSSRRTVFVECGGDVTGGRILMRQVQPTGIQKANAEFKKRVRERTSVTFEAIDLKGRPLRSVRLSILLCRAGELGGPSSRLFSARKYKLGRFGKLHALIPNPPPGWKTVVYVYGVSGGGPAIMSPAAGGVPDILFATR